jgi:hypothetical protein
MPRPPRDERRAQLARTGRQWGQWLRTAMTQNGVDTKTLIERAGHQGASFAGSNVSKWLSGDNTADPANVVVIARVLHRDIAEALRAAGHTTIADAMARRGPDATEPATATARAWHTWLLDAAGTHEAILALSTRSNGAIGPETAQAWAEGTETATPVAAILTARLLRVPEAPALLAAGHETYAGVFAALATSAPAPTPVLNGEH